MPAAAPAPAALRIRPPSDEPPPWVDAPIDMSDDDRPTEPAATVASEPVALRASVISPVRTPMGDRWLDVVQQMIERGSISALVRELALQSQCLSVSDEGAFAVWRLRTERETLRAAAQRDKLQAALAQLLGQPVRLECEAGVAEDSPALRAAAERERRQQEAEQIIHNDPLVRTLMAQFKTARIVPGSITPH
jgi:DNA polymerase-3 subunit gamma/tau